MTSPKVSVCIDSFNYGRFLPEAIESVLGQSFQDFEVIISDDCSTDDSFAIAQRYAEAGPPYSRNANRAQSRDGEESQRGSRARAGGVCQDSARGRFPLFSRSPEPNGGGAGEQSRSESGGVSAPDRG